MEDMDLNRRVTSLLYNIPFDPRSQSSALVCSPTSSSQNRPWDYRYGFESRGSNNKDDDRILLTPKEDHKTKRSSINQVGTKIPDEISVNARANGKTQPPTEKGIVVTNENRSQGISLREWLKCESVVKVDKSEKVKIFKHIVNLVDFAQSQGSSLRDLRPSCFVVLPSNEIRYTGSLAMRETRKRPMNQNPFENDVNGVKRQKISNNQCNRNSSIGVIGQYEKEWYTSPESLIDQESCSFSSNIYCLGILFFELLCRYESWETHLAIMSDLRRRILPGKFLLENPVESAFCLRLLHPEVLSRPTTREILQFEVLRDSQDSFSVVDDDANVDPQSELLLKFFRSLKEEKESRAAKLLEDIGCLEEDIKGVDRKYSLTMRTSSVSSKNDDRLTKNTDQLEKAYFSMKSQVKSTPEKVSNELTEAFFDGLCKFSRYSEFKVCGTLRNGDLFNSTNAICSLSFDRDEDYIALAKVSKKIKIFEYGTLLNDYADIHYPVVEMSNKSKLSCVCWNYYIKNYLASTDYDGAVKMWDAGTGKEFLQYTEHQKRAWSVDFSRADPTMFASGSDDCSVRLWSINDKSSIGTIWSPANVCCVQFSDYSSHELVFGSADYKIYGYDLRHIKSPLHTFSGHGKAVSYVKFADAETLVSASTDNTLKLWSLKKKDTDSCSLTFTGHTNEKNFVGLSVLDGYIVCGSETNEVYSYYRSLPMPITSHKFKTVDAVSGDETGDDCSQFVSSVCWRRKSNTVVAANSSGLLKLLQMA